MLFISTVNMMGNCQLQMTVFITFLFLFKLCNPTLPQSLILILFFSWYVRI